MSNKKYRNAVIKAVLNGFIIEIGCQQAVAETPEKLLELITNYVNDPEGTEKKMMGESFVYGTINGAENGPVGYAMERAEPMPPEPPPYLTEEPARR